MQTSSLIEKCISVLAGLLLTGVIGIAAIGLGKLPAVAALGFGTLTLAIIIGMLVGNTVYPLISCPCHSGVQFAKQYLLRLGIILYGFNLTFQQVLSVGLSAIIIDVLVILSTFLLAWWLGKKVFGMDAQTTILIGSGASICGAAAVMAVEPVIKAESEKIAVAVSTVVIFGTLAMFLYPWLYHFNLHHPLIALSPSQFGLYTGSTVHEVAQVVAAGRAISDEAGNTAVITKMIRVMLLAPFLLIISSVFSRSLATTPGNARSRIVIPWFAVLFIAVAGFNSLSLLPDTWVYVLKQADTLFLTMAMAALGVTTHLRAVRQAGAKPLLLAAILFLWLVIGGLLINQVTLSLVG